MVNVGVRARHHVELRGDLRLRVERDGPKLGVLRDVCVRLRHLAVVAARREKHEPAHIAGRRRIEEPRRRLHIRLPSQLGCPLTRGVADHRGEVNNGVDILYCSREARRSREHPLARTRTSGVPKLKAGSLSVNKAVENPDGVTSSQQLLDEN